MTAQEYERKEVERLEKISRFYEQGDRMDELLVDREVELVKSVVRKTRRALEVGCGNGYSTFLLIDLFKDFEVLEPSAKNIELMQKRVQRKVVVHAKFVSEMSPEKKYDYIIYLNVIEHVEYPVKELALLKNMLKKDGIIFISAPNCMSLNRRAGYEMGLLEDYSTMAPKDYAVGHRRLYTVDMMKKHIEKAGLRVVALKGVYLKPLAERQMIELGEECIQAFHKLGEELPQYCANIFAVAGLKQSGRD
jgi:2-polyprenyl-3-methyl-5-hydroxy-6-metoxy-1,4-benzoquinol methylase